MSPEDFLTVLQRSDSREHHSRKLCLRFWAPHQGVTQEMLDYSLVNVRALLYGADTAELGMESSKYTTMR